MKNIFPTMHVLEQLWIPLNTFSPKLHHNVFLSAVTVPLLQLLVEQHDVTVVTLNPDTVAFIVYAVQDNEHEYSVDGIPTEVVVVWVFWIYV